MKDELYLLDSYAIIFRSYYAFIHSPRQNPSGQNVSAVYGYFRTLFNIFKNHKPKLFAAVFDSPSKTFRHEIYDKYKAQRQKPPEDLYMQIPIIKEILRKMEIPILMENGYEADDIIASLTELCNKENRGVKIISGDKDLLQLVNDTVFALKPGNNFALTPLGRAEVLGEWGILPEQVLDYLSLTGDSSDNVPGVPGIGDKTALKLITEFGSLDSIYKNIEDVKPPSLKAKLISGKDDALLSKKLITLEKAVPLKIKDLSELDISKSDRTKANPIFEREGMKSLILQDSAEAVLPKTSSKAKSKKSDEDLEEEVKINLDQKLADKKYLGEGSYKAILELEDLSKLISNCTKAGAFAFDVETDGLDELSANIVGFSISYSLKEAFYVPIKCTDQTCINTELILKELKKLFGTKSIVIGHNIKYDLHILRRLGINVNANIQDTMVAAWLLNSNFHYIALSDLAKSRLGEAGISYEEIVPKGASIDMVPLENVCKYASEDADFTFRIYKILIEELKSEGLLKVFNEIEMCLLPILLDMEAEGIFMDFAELNKFGKKVEKSLNLIQEKIWAEVGYEFNISSPKQLQEVLFVKRKLKPGKKNKTGYSTDYKVLEELAEIDIVPEMILRHRTLAKLKNTYVDAFIKISQNSKTKQDSNSDKTKIGRIHTHYLQTGAATGRLASKDPNLQNIPIREDEGRGIRKAFVSKTNYSFISADYSQIELVVLAHLSKDTKLRSAFMDGVDIHKRTASLIFKIDENNVSDEQRRIAKTINFGVLYGMSAFRLSREMKITNKEANDFIAGYFANYSNLDLYMNEVYEFARKNGFVRTITGRKRIIEGINSNNKTLINQAQRVALNTCIQGSAADIVKIAMIKVYGALEKKYPDSKLLLQVHDELIIEVPDSDIKNVSELVKKEMQEAYLLELPLKVNVESAKSWGEMH